MAVKTPPDLDDAGRRLWRAVAAWRREHDLELEPWEVEMVTEVCRAVDRLAALRARMADAGDEGRWLALVKEERQQRAILGRVVAASGLPTGLVDQDSTAGRTPKSRRAQRAAEARWHAAS